MGNGIFMGKDRNTGTTTMDNYMHRIFPKYFDDKPNQYFYKKNNQETIFGRFFFGGGAFQIFVYDMHDMQSSNTAKGNRKVRGSEVQS